MSANAPNPFLFRPDTNVPAYDFPDYGNHSSAFGSSGFKPSVRCKNLSLYGWGVRGKA